MRKIITLFIFLLGGIMLSHGQITIGSGHTPNSGALLDLKEKNKDDGTANSTKGLLLPRVVLNTMNPAIGELAKSIGATGNWDENIHTGLTVYNTKNTLDACTGGAYVGLHTWNGEKWTTQYAKPLTPPAEEKTSDDFDGANSYLVKPNNTIAIPLKRAFDIWTAYSSSSPSTGRVLNLVDVNNFSGTLSSEVVWQDAGALTSAVVNGTGNTATLTVNAGGSAGNALVRVSIGDKVLWQWHIWVTDTDPLQNAYPYIVNDKTDWYMDRFLGANGTSGTEANGLYYQWGRNVPLSKTGAVDTVDATNLEKDNLTSAIQSEKFILYYSTTSHDWYSSTPKQWDARWGDLNGGQTKKSPFDPCPYGWRLPSALNDKSPWECLDVNTSGGGTNGWQFNELGRELGTFASVGYRSNGDGSLGDVSKAGYVWTASPNGVMAGALYYNSSEINIWDQYNRANAMNVRCIKDK